MNDQVKQYLAAIGRRGGQSGRGKSKARTKAQARRAAKIRWDTSCTLCGDPDCTGLKHLNEAKPANAIKLSHRPETPQ